MIDYLLHEIAPTGSESEIPDVEILNNTARSPTRTAASDTEHDALLWTQNRSMTENDATALAPDLGKAGLISTFIGLNALEIATVAEAKHFISQRIVQKVVNDIWNGKSRSETFLDRLYLTFAGHIVFWESLSVHSKKQAKVYNQRLVDDSRWPTIVGLDFYIGLHAFASIDHVPPYS